jgi:hypothetical protein
MRKGGSKAGSIPRNPAGELPIESLQTPPPELPAGVRPYCKGAPLQHHQTALGPGQAERSMVKRSSRTVRTPTRSTLQEML